MTTETLEHSLARDAQVTITVYGLPAPQGSKSPKGRTRDGHTILVESSKRVKPWREAVKAAALETLHPWTEWDILSRACAVCSAAQSQHSPFDVPVVADMVFTFARPKGHYRTGRNAHLLRDAAPGWPAGVPDLSKLARSTEDALTDAGAWKDDARVVAYGRLAKVYAGSGDPDALHIPGAVIRIRPAVTA